MSGAPQFNVRAATPAEAAAGPLLLHDAYRQSRDLVLSLAVIDTPFRIVGAAVLEPYVSFSDPGGYRGDVHVIAPFRHQGVGRALVSRLANQTHEAGVAALYAWQPIEDPAVAAFLESEGFRARKRVTNYRADLRVFHERMRPIAERIARLGHMPAAARIVPLSQAPADQVVKLHVEYLGGSSELVAPRVHNTAVVGFSPDISQVLMLNGSVYGAVLVRRAGNTSIADARIVHPDFRSGWANILLMAVTAEMALAAGCVELEFAADDENHDTHKLAVRSDAQVISRSGLYCRLLMDVPALRG